MICFDGRKNIFIDLSQIKLGSFSELVSSCLFINRSITLFMAFEPLCLLDEFTLNRETEIYPRWCSGKESACQCRGHRFYPWVRKIPWRRKWQPIPIFLPGKFHGQRSLAGYSPQGLQRVRHDGVHTHAGDILYKFVLYGTHTKLILKQLLNYQDR